MLAGPFIIRQYGQSELRPCPRKCQLVSLWGDRALLAVIGLFGIPRCKCTRLAPIPSCCEGRRKEAGAGAAGAAGAAAAEEQQQQQRRHVRQSAGFACGILGMGVRVDGCGVGVRLRVSVSAWLVPVVILCVYMRVCVRVCARARGSIPF